jgi:hypothetical protein
MNVTGYLELGGKVVPVINALVSLFCSDPACRYCRELREAQEEMRTTNEDQNAVTDDLDSVVGTNADHAPEAARDASPAGALRTDRTATVGSPLWPRSATTG